MSNEMKPMPRTRLYFGDQHALFVGVTTATKHKHHAVQISVALTQPFRLRLEGGSWSEYRSVIIRPDVEHEFDSCNAAVANMFLDVESTDYLVILKAEPNIEIVGTHGFEVPDELLQALRSFHSGVTPISIAPDLCVLIVEAFLGNKLGQVRVDPRIGTVLKLITKNPAEKINVQRLASAVALSTSRLAHLFSQGVGIPIRRFRIWKAVREAIRLSLAGASLTEAALSTGFTDSAHFSNVFRDLFGMSPSNLLSSRSRVEILLGSDT